MRASQRFIVLYSLLLSIWTISLWFVRPNNALPRSTRPSSCATTMQGYFFQLNQTTVVRDFRYLFEGNFAAVDDHSNTTACQFHLQDAYSFHFPHAMQQLYRCWSLWNKNRSQQPILIFPRNQMPDNPFLRGFVEALQRTIGLQVVKPNHRATSQLDVVRPRVPPNTMNVNDTFALQDPTLPFYAFLQKDDAASLRDTVSQSTTTPSCVGPFPRVGILNRDKNRQWRNAHEFVRNHTTEARTAVPMVTFDHNVSFAAQVDFFRHTDIVLSPHGAQLTGLPFLPDCGALLEIFPPGYHLPHFFGSLASAASHLHYAYIVLTTENKNWQQQALQGMQTRHSRARVRNRPLCPKLDTVSFGLEQLIGQWQRCCERRRSSTNAS